MSGIVVHDVKFRKNQKIIMLKKYEDERENMRGLVNAHRVETLNPPFCVKEPEKSQHCLQSQAQRSFRGLGENLKSHVSCLVLQRWPDLYAIDSFLQKSI